MTEAAAEDDRAGPGHAWPDAPDPEPQGGPPPERPARPTAVVVGSTALALGSGIQLSIVATILLGGIEPTALAPLALTAGLATFGMVAAIRAWSGRDWGVAVGAGSLELFVAAWLFGFTLIGWLLVVLISIALMGLARGRSWFQRTDDEAVR